MSFSTIPTRANGNKIDASWFEALKTAGIATDANVTANTATIATHTAAIAALPATYFTGLLSVATKSAAYTLVSTNDVILANAAGAAFTLTLPTASTVTGKVFHIKKTDSTTNAVTVSRGGSDTIDGATSQSLTFQYQSMDLVSDGTNWYTL